MAQDLNYYDTFITVAPDSDAPTGREPVAGARLTVARAQFEMLAAGPYRWTQEEVLVATSAGLRGRDALDESDRERLRAEFLSRPQACMRASPLPKTHGWGLHFDSAGRVAMFPVGSVDYERFLADDATTKLRAMASKRR